MEKVEDDTGQVWSQAVIESPTCHMPQLTAPLLRNVKGQQSASSLYCSVPFVYVCVQLLICSSCVSIDPRHVESGDGAVAEWYASCWSSVCVLSQEASKSRRWGYSMTQVNSIKPVVQSSLNKCNMNRVEDIKLGFVMLKNKNRSLLSLFQHLRWCNRATHYPYSVKLSFYLH